MCLLAHRKLSSTGIQRLLALYTAPFSGATLSPRSPEDLSAKNSPPTGIGVGSQGGRELLRWVELEGVAWNLGADSGEIGGAWGRVLEKGGACDCGRWKSQRRGAGGSGKLGSDVGGKSRILGMAE